MRTPPFVPRIISATLKVITIETFHTLYFSSLYCVSDSTEEQLYCGHFVKSNTENWERVWGRG